MQEFYIEASSQIKRRFPIGDLTIKLLQVIDPNASHSEFPSLVPLATRFPNFLHPSKIQRLDDEWRRLGIGPLPFEHTDMDPEEFWHRMSQISDGTEVPPFQVLCHFMQTLLCLPHSNVDVERTFSEVTAIKTKKRNRLKVKTICALLQVKNAVKETGGCTKFSPPIGAKKLMSSHTLHDSSDSDSD